MTTTSIEWTERTWNPVRGCSRVSPGCDNCYAMNMAHRFSGPGKPYERLTTIRRGKVDWSGVARFVPEMLDAPLRVRKPTTWFVNSMSDLFHHSVTNEEIAAVFGVMAACPQHTFQVLTKRAERLPEWFNWYEGSSGTGASPYAAVLEALSIVPTRPDWHLGADRVKRAADTTPWPLPNVWLGVSAEDQKRADERVPRLLETPAAVRFVSLEPLLGPIDMFAFIRGEIRDKALGVLIGDTGRRLPGIDWVIVGGESGPGARLADLAYTRAIIEQCKAAGVAVFHKQAGANVLDSDYGLHPLTLKSRKGNDPSEWPEELRVREMPTTRETP